MGLLDVLWPRKRPNGSANSDLDEAMAENRKARRALAEAIAENEPDATLRELARRLGKRDAVV